MDLSQIKAARDRKPKAGAEEKTASILDREISLGSNRISDKHKHLIYHQLYNLIDAGTDIGYAFTVLENQVKSKQVKRKIAGIKDQIIRGKTLSEAMSTGKDFSRYEYYSVKIGEETGRLTDVLEQLYTYFEEKQAQKRQVIAALSYPVLILFSSAGAVAFMLLFIIPLFRDIFSRFGSELPWITQVILKLSDLLADNYLYILLVLGGLFMVHRLLRDKKRYRRLTESLILRLPVFGSLYRTIFMARFCTSMSLLIKAEVPLINALEMVRNMITFQHLEEPVSQIRERIMAGDSLHKSMSAFSIFDHEMLGLVKVGEEVNRLGDFFGKLSKSYTEQARHKTGLMGTVLEPALIIFLGVVVSVILVAMYLPMFELSSNMGM